MKICNSLSQLEAALQTIGPGEDIGFVPTMGALHKGHISLVSKSLSYTKNTIVSLFVNPTQFNNPNDLATYPRTEEADCDLLRQAGASIVFIPSVNDIYPSDDNRLFDLGGLDSYGEGPKRPGHFNGVAQVVTRLFDIVKPTYAFFGEKDFQQLAIIKYITKGLNYPVTIVPCPTLREDDGLAMSSRNMLLSPEHREAAPVIYRCLTEAVSMVGSATPQELSQKVTEMINSNPMLECEYIEILNSLTLQPVTRWDDAAEVQMCAAVFAGKVRLIDNIKLK